MPQPTPQPAMRKTGLRKAPNAGVHPFATTAPQDTPSAPPQPSTERLTAYGRPSVNDGRSQFAVRLPDDLISDIAIHCATHRVTRRDLTEAALREYLNRQN